MRAEERIFWVKGTRCKGPEADGRLTAGRSWKRTIVSGSYFLKTWERVPGKLHLGSLPSPGPVSAFMSALQ